MELELNQLEIDGGTQPRVAINEDTVGEYAEALREGADFPPVVVFHDGAHYWLADGFHRYHAHRRAGRQQIDADVRKGTLREAILHSVGANGQHGLRRSPEDKRNAVTTLLTNELVANDDDGNPWSNREIARRCHVSEFLVRQIRKDHPSTASDHTAIESQYESGNRAFIHPKTKQPTTMKTGNIGGSNRTGRKPAREWGGISANAMTPVRGHSRPLAQTTLNIPHNPESAARALVSAFGEEFARSLIEKLSNYLQGAQA